MKKDGHRIVTRIVHKLIFTDILEDNDILYAVSSFFLIYKTDYSGPSFCFYTVRQLVELQKEKRGLGKNILVPIPIYVKLATQTAVVRDIDGLMVLLFLFWFPLDLSTFGCALAYVALIRPKMAASAQVYLALRVSPRFLTPYYSIDTRKCSMSILYATYCAYENGFLL